jgi:hypothetical protein
MQKWEYAVARVNHARDYYMLGRSDEKKNGVTQYLDESGAWGWELVAVVPCTDPDHEGENRLYFKKPLEEKPKSR